MTRNPSATAPWVNYNFQSLAAAGQAVLGPNKGIYGPTATPQADGFLVLGPDVAALGGPTTLGQEFVVPPATPGYHNVPATTDPCSPAQPDAHYRPGGRSTRPSPRPS